MEQRAAAALDVGRAFHAEGDLQIGPVFHDLALLRLDAQVADVRAVDAARALGRVLNGVLNGVFEALRAARYQFHDLRGAMGVYRWRFILLLHLHGFHPDAMDRRCYLGIGPPGSGAHVRRPSCTRDNCEAISGRRITR